MPDAHDRDARGMLPVPDRAAPGLTTHHAMHPETSYPPIDALLPPAGAPNVLIAMARQ